MCVYITVNLSYTYWDLLQVKFEGKKWFVINCANSDGLDGFLTSEKWASDQSQVLNEIFDLWKKYYESFFAFVVWGLAKVNESEFQQYLLAAYNCI